MAAAASAPSRVHRSWASRCWWAAGASEEPWRTTSAASSSYCRPVLAVDRTMDLLWTVESSAVVVAAVADELLTWACRADRDWAVVHLAGSYSSSVLTSCTGLDWACGVSTTSCHTHVAVFSYWLFARRRFFGEYSKTRSSYSRIFAFYY